MSEFKYKVGDILEDAVGNIVEVIAVNGDHLHPYRIECVDNPSLCVRYAERELTWPKATGFKEGQVVEIVNTNVSSLDIVGDRGTIFSIDDPVVDHLPIRVEMESGFLWALSPTELKVIKDVEEVSMEDEREKFMSNWENGTFSVKLTTYTEAAKILFAVLGSVSPVNDESRSLSHLLDELLRHFPDPDLAFEEAIRYHEVHFLNSSFYVGEPDDSFVNKMAFGPEGRENEIAFYRQQVLELSNENDSLKQENDKYKRALERSRTQCRELIEVATDAEFTCKELALNIEELREEHCKRAEEYNREENASE